MQRGAGRALACLHARIKEEGGEASSALEVLDKMPKGKKTRRKEGLGFDQIRAKSFQRAGGPVHTQKHMMDKRRGVGFDFDEFGLI